MQNERDYKAFYRPQTQSANSNSSQQSALPRKSNAALPTNIDRIVMRHVRNSVGNYSPCFEPISNNSNSNAPLTINNFIVNSRIWDNSNAPYNSMEPTTTPARPNTIEKQITQKIPGESTYFNPIRRRCDSQFTRPNSEALSTNTQSGSAGAETGTQRISCKDIYLAQTSAKAHSIQSTPKSQHAATSASKSLIAEETVASASPKRILSQLQPKAGGQIKTTEAKNAIHNDAAYDTLKCKLKGLFYQFKPGATKIELRKLTSDVVDEILKSGVQFDRIVRSLKKNQEVNQSAPVAASTPINRAVPPTTNLIAMKKFSKSNELRRIEVSESFSCTPLNDKRQPKPIRRFSPDYFERPQRKRKRSVSRDPRAPVAKRSRSVDVRKSAWCDEFMERSYCKPPIKPINRRASLGYGLFSSDTNGRVFSFCV